MIRLVRVSHGAPRRILQHVSLHLPGGWLGVITGGVGSGKTLILRLCAGAVLPDEGSVVIDGIETAEAGRRQQRRLRLNTGLISADLPLQDGFTVVENCLFSLALRGIGGRRALRAALRTLDALDALELAHAFPRELSAGQRQLALIARALAPRPRIVLADEPVALLSPPLQVQVMALLDDHARRGGTVLIASRDPTTAPPNARLWRLEGRTVGPPQVVGPESTPSRSALLRALLSERGAA